MYKYKYIISNKISNISILSNTLPNVSAIKR